MSRKTSTSRSALLGYLVVLLLILAAGPAGSAMAQASDEEVYESGLYGYTLVYDASNWSIYSGDDNPGDRYDQVTFVNASERSLVGIIGDPDYTATQLTQCVDDYIAGLEGQTNVRDVQPMNDPEATGEQNDRAWATTAFTVPADDRNAPDLDFIRYTECRWMGGGVTVSIQHNALVADYQREIDERTALLEGLYPSTGKPQFGSDMQNGGQADTAPGDAAPDSVFRGDPAHTGVQPGPGPDGKLTVRWVAELPASNAPPVSPSLQNGMLYVLGQDGLHAIDTESGEQRWIVEAAGGLTAAPAIADGIVYFTAYDGVYAVDAVDGNVLWRLNEEGGASASPAASDGRVYVIIGDGHLLALDGKTGEERWRMDSGTDHASPTIVDGVIYIGGFIYRNSPDDGDVLWALDAESGDEIWHMKSEARLDGPPAVVDGLIYIGGENGTLYVVDAATGKEQWRYAGKELSPGGPSPVPAVADGVVYYGSWDGAFVALDAKTGDLIWQQDIGGVALLPVVAGDALYVLPPVSLLVLDTATGETQAELEDLGIILSTEGLPLSGGIIQTSPLVVDGVVYVVLDRGVVAIEGTS